MARLLASIVRWRLAVVRTVVVSVMVPVVVMMVVPRGIVGTMARLGDAGSADHHRAGGAEQCDCA